MRRVRLTPLLVSQLWMPLLKLPVGAKSLISLQTTHIALNNDGFNGACRRKKTREACFQLSSAQSAVQPMSSGLRACPSSGRYGSAKTAVTAE